MDGPHHDDADQARHDKEVREELEHLGFRVIALAYVHRDFVQPGTPVVVQGAPATVVALPFVPR